MSTIGKVCAKCQVELRPKKNGVEMVEMAHFGPSAIHQADLWSCPECGLEVVVGFAKGPHIRHYQPEFEGVLDRLRQNTSILVMEFWATARDKATYEPVEETE